MPDSDKVLNRFTEKDIENLAFIVEDFEDAIICCNLKGIVKNYNKGAERIYGYLKDEIIGKSISILISNEKEMRDILYRISNNNIIRHHEAIRKKKNGEIILVSISVSPVHNRSGKVISLVCIARDITERQKLISELKESEKKYKFAIEGSNFGVWDWDIKTNIVFYSSRWKKMLGYRDDEIGNTNDEWLNRIHIEDFQHVMEKVDRHFNGEEYFVEYRIRCKDGCFKWIRTRGKIVERNSDGEPIRMIGTNEDINEAMILRKKIEESENRLRKLYDSISSGVALGEIILDDDKLPVSYKCIHMNNAMAKILGEEDDNFSDESTQKILNKYGAKWINMFYEASQNEKSYKFIEYDKTSEKYFDISIYSPNLNQFAILITDISEIKKNEIKLNEKYEELSAVYEELAATEEELRQNYKELEKASEEIKKANMAKSQFLANMSHELRTPLNGILGFTQLLQLSQLNNEQKYELSMIEKSSKHLLGLINDILDLSKIEAGKVELRYEKFNLKEQMEYVIKELILLAKDKNIEVMYYVDPFINIELSGDILRLKQILYNLISNAVKFTDNGHIYFKVKEVSKTLKESKLQFSVEDTGKGIEKDFQNEIFNKFTQEEYSYTKKYGGTGLGLAISKELVRLMDGDIGFESEIGKGSTFYFTAVFKNVDDKDYFLDNKKDIQNKEEVHKHDIILVVEDNEINLKITSAFLKQLNYKYFCVRNGKEAVDYLEKNRINIILMDVQMPVLSGYDATKIIRNREKEAKGHRIIIAMTSYAMNGDREKFIECGMDDYISKPFDIDTLDDMLKKYISN